MVFNFGALILCGPPLGVILIHVPFALNIRSRAMCCFIYKILLLPLSIGLSLYLRQPWASTQLTL